LAFRKIAGRYDDGIIVEEEVTGEAVRFLYVAPRVTAIRVEIPPNIVGDGRHSIADLIAEKNQERDRRRLPSHVPIRVDEEAVRFLETQDLDLGSVPAAGKRIRLRGTSNAPSGGDMLQWPGSVHPSYSTIVEQAAIAMGHLKVAGFDLAIENPQQPAETGNHRFLEVNSSPGLVVFYFPWEGFGQDAAGDLLDRMVDGGW
jgi:D-alanine-D-alanine ligase-like ATP-grasp enzyme